MRSKCRVITSLQLHQVIESDRLAGRAETVRMPVSGVVFIKAQSYTCTFPG